MHVGRVGGGRRGWGLVWWAAPGGGLGLVQCYGVDQYGKTQTLAVLFTTLTNTLSGGHTQKSVRQEETRTNY